MFELQDSIIIMCCSYALKKMVISEIGPTECIFAFFVEF